jgi:hypothetical protein
VLRVERQLRVPILSECLSASGGNYSQIELTFFGRESREYWLLGSSCFLFAEVTTRTWDGHRMAESAFAHIREISVR